MTKRQVFTVPSGSEVTRRCLEDLLAQLTCVNQVRAIGEADVVVVLMGGMLPGEAEFRSMLLPAADGVFVLIGVHAPDGDATIPTIMEDWATGGFYPLDVEALRAALCDAEEGWLDAGGGLRPEPKTERECSRRNC